METQIAQESMLSISQFIAIIVPCMAGIILGFYIIFSKLNKQSSDIENLKEDRNDLYKERDILREGIKHIEDIRHKDFIEFSRVLGEFSNSLVRFETTLGHFEKTLERLNS